MAAPFPPQGNQTPHTERPLRVYAEQYVPPTLPIGAVIDPGDPPIFQDGQPRVPLALGWAVVQPTDWVISNRYTGTPMEVISAEEFAERFGPSGAPLAEGALMLTYALNVYRGDTHRWRFLLWADAARTVPVDLTGVTVAAEIRSGPGTTPMVPLALVVTLPNTIEATLSPLAGQLVPTASKWDLQLTYPSGDVQTVVAGSVLVTGDITASVPLVRGPRG